MTDEEHFRGHPKPNSLFYDHIRDSGEPHDLRGADLIYRNLENAILDGSKLNDANLTKANLNGASLSKADLRGANFTDACLDYVAFDEALMDEQTKIDPKWRFVWEVVNNKLDTKDFSGRDFSKARLSHIDFSDADLQNADFTGAMLWEVTFQNAALKGTVFKDLGHVRQLIFHNATIDEHTVMDDNIRLIWEIVNQGVSNRNLNNVNLFSTYLKGARFENVSLQNADLRGANLEGAIFQSSDLSNIAIRAACLQNATFENVDLRGANIVSSDLENADLGKALIDETTDLTDARYDSETKWPDGFDFTNRDMTFIGS